MARHLEVQTAQHVAIGYTAASVGDRILAYIIDLVILFIFSIGMIILLVVIGAITGFTNRGFLFAFPFALFLPVVLYDLVMEYFFNGQSIGKKIRKIKIKDAIPVSAATRLFSSSRNCRPLWMVSFTPRLRSSTGIDANPHKARAAPHAQGRSSLWGQRQSPFMPSNTRSSMIVSKRSSFSNPL